MNSPNFPPLTDNDEVHQELARGAVAHANEVLETLAEYGEFDLTLPTSDVVNEALAAWAGIGLVHQSYSERDQREIVTAIIGRTATVLAIVGWQPPARLLTDPAAKEPSG
ncbi:hypothetical protein PV646_28565 [Streptomyces sp. ID05-26A]|nr:hypothetical protein [Streptomyces sp. ID05-26A]